MKTIKGTNGYFFIVMVVALITAMTFSCVARGQSDSTSMAKADSVIIVTQENPFLENIPDAVKDHYWDVCERVIDLYYSKPINVYEYYRRVCDMYNGCMLAYLDAQFE